MGQGFSEIHLTATWLFGPSLVMWDQMGHVPSTLTLGTDKTLEMDMGSTPTLAIYQLGEF